MLEKEDASGWKPKKKLCGARAQEFSTFWCDCRSAVDFSSETLRVGASFLDHCEFKQKNAQCEFAYH